MIAGLLLFPGAGSDAAHSSLMAIERAVQPLPVARIDFPYRLAGRRTPDRAPVLVRAVREAVDDACRRWSCEPGHLVIGGRSMGGRMCSMVVAGFDGNERVAQPSFPGLRVAGLVCVGYPLHPPRQPQKLRVAHLPHLVVPSLFVSGTRDEFATPDELRHHLAPVSAPVQVQLVEGGRHDLRGRDDVVAEVVADWIRSLN